MHLKRGKRSIYMTTSKSQKSTLGTQQMLLFPPLHAHITRLHNNIDKVCKESPASNQALGFYTWHTEDSPG